MRLKWQKVALVTFSIVLMTVIVLFLYLRSVGFFRTPAYDVLAPQIPEFSRPAILVLYKTNGFIHKEALPAANELLQALAEEQSWDIYVTDNAATHNLNYLNRFDLVVWNNTSGDILTPEQKEDFKNWLSGGGKFLGLHAAGGDSSYQWSWQPEELIAAQFVSHTMSPQFQSADVLVASRSELTSHFPSPWHVDKEEWYSFDRNPRESGSEILLTVDESSYQPLNKYFFEDASMPGEHPIAWRHNLGDGQVIYSAIGHRAETYQLKAYQTFIRKSMQWLIGKPDVSVSTEKLLMIGEGES